MLHSSLTPASHQNAARRAAGHSAGRLVSSVDCEPNAKAGVGWRIALEHLATSVASPLASADRLQDDADSTTSELAGCGLDFFSVSLKALSCS